MAAMSTAAAAVAAVVVGWSDFCVPLVFLSLLLLSLTELQIQPPKPPDPTSTWQQHPLSLKDSDSSLFQQPQLRLGSLPPMGAGGVLRPDALLWYGYERMRRGIIRCRNVLCRECQMQQDHKSVRGILQTEGLRH